MVALLLLSAALATAQVDTAWVRRYDGPMHGEDLATCLAVDSAGNVYVAGPSAEDTGNARLDFVTIKYRPNGDTAWVRRKVFSSNGIPSGLGVDAGGNVYVSGTGDGQLALVKYDLTGVEEWTRLRGSAWGAGNLALDSRGNILTCGSEQRSSIDCVVAKYLPSGDTAWVRSYDWAGFEDAVSELAIATDDGVYAAGTCSNSNPGSNILVYSLDSTGTRRWVSVYDGPQHGDDRVWAVAPCEAGGCVSTGPSDNGYGTPFDYLTIKYSSTGETLWTRRYNGTANGDDNARAVTSDSAGNVYVTGSARYADTYFDFATIKYRPDSSMAWLVRYDGPTHSGDGAYAVAVDASSKAYVTGSTYTPATLADCATVCYDSTGDTLWVRRYDSPQNWAEYTTALALGADGSVCVAGTAYGGGAGRTIPDILTIKYVQSGAVAETCRRPNAHTGLRVAPSAFRYSTDLSVDIPRDGQALLVVRDVSGRLVRTLIHGAVSSGHQSMVWDRTDDAGKLVAAGVYVVEMESRGISCRTKVLAVD
jgi:hypothetical protein